MSEMSEADIYNFIIKDGTNPEDIRKNTQKLRETLEDEMERRIHSLTQLDPDNRGRHERESGRIFEEKNRKIDSVLLKIAENASVQLPLSREAALKVSTEITGSRKSADMVSGFIRGVLSFCMYAAAVLIVVVAIEYFADTNKSFISVCEKYFVFIGKSTEILVILTIGALIKGVVVATGSKE